LGEGMGARVRAFANGLYPPATLAAFAAQIAADRPDIVHTHELYPLITPWVFEVCARAGVPVVHSCYDFRITCPVATHHDGARVCTECLDRGAQRVALKNCRDNLPESIAFGLRHAIAARRDVYRRHVARFVVLTEFSRDWLVARAG
ncbi:glycosyltransferase, partial [Clostridium perfringens]